MKAISLAANPRTLTKTTGSKKVRQGGGLPGVIYGNGDPQSIEIEAKQFGKAVKSTEAKNFLVELDIEGKKSIALVQDVQKNPLTNLFIHVDFKRLTKDSVVTAQVPLYPIGTAEGVKQGGVMQTAMHTITLKGRPANIPDSLELDVSDMEVGQSRYLEDLDLPKGVVATGQPKALVIAIATSRMQMMAEAEEAAAAEAAAEGGAEGAAAEGETPAQEGAKEEGAADAAEGGDKKEG
ncbi:MAG: 50S ribosomal protein L25 [Verrucomicrobiota bacterium]|jgi:large subunit ribosomal protein L25|nr:50S ribosomal protein L25 [Verrucomicrobiota bacterium]MDP7049270.1 50S ribosomal protein L25 [Verrucomicrobiota bacterium]